MAWNIWRRVWRAILALAGASFASLSGAKGQDDDISRFAEPMADAGGVSALIDARPSGARGYGGTWQFRPDDPPSALRGAPVLPAPNVH